MYYAIFFNKMEKYVSIYHKLFNILTNFSVLQFKCFRFFLFNYGELINDQHIFHNSYFIHFIAVNFIVRLYLLKRANFIILPFFQIILP